jgi:recA bacterial DNA recombination protein
VRPLSHGLIHIRSSFPKGRLTVRRRLSSGLDALDALLDGGLVRGRVSELIGPIGAGRTTVAARFVAVATRVGEVVAWLETTRSFAPAAIAASSASLEQVLWALVDDRHQLVPELAGGCRRSRSAAVFQAAELLLQAGGFGLVVIDLGARAAPLPPSIALRLARATERSGAAVIVMAPHRLCGTFAALSLQLRRIEAVFNRLTPASPWLFDGLVIRTSTVRNKLGRMGGSTIICAAIEPVTPAFTRRADHVLLAPTRLHASHA